MQIRFSVTLSSTPSNDEYTRLLTEIRKVYFLENSRNFNVMSRMPTSTTRNSFISFFKREDIRCLTSKHHHLSLSSRLPYRHPNALYFHSKHHEHAVIGLRHKLPPPPIKKKRRISVDALKSTLNMKSEHFNDSRCNICQCSFPSTYQAQQHLSSSKHWKKMLEHHSNEYRDECIYCNVTFTDSKSRSNHLSSTQHHQMIHDLLHQLNPSAKPLKSTKNNHSASTTVVTNPKHSIHIKGVYGTHYVDDHCYVCNLSFDAMNRSNLEAHINGTKHIKNVLAHYSGNYADQCIYCSADCRTAEQKHIHISSATHSAFINSIIQESQSKTSKDFVLSLGECQHRASSGHDTVTGNHSKNAGSTSSGKSSKKSVPVQSMSASKLRKAISEYFSTPSAQSIEHQFVLLEKLHKRSGVLTEKDHLSILFVLSALVRVQNNENLDILGDGLIRICKLFSEYLETLQPSKWKMSHKLFEQMIDTILLSTNLSQLLIDFDNLISAEMEPRKAYDLLMGIEAERQFLEPFEILFAHFADTDKWKEGSFDNDGAHRYFMKWTELIFVDMVHGLRDIMRYQQINFDLEYRRMLMNAMAFAQSSNSNHSLNANPIQIREHCAFREIKRISTGNGPFTVITMESSLEEMVAAQSKGSFVILFPENVMTNKIDRHRAQIGYIYKTNALSQSITLRIATYSEDIESAEHYRWHILSMGASATSFESQWEALQRITCDPNGEIASSLKRTLFGDVDLEIDRVVTADVMTKDLVDTQLVLQLNASQRSAVECALNHDITLIQGPPGTGKTHVAAAIVEQFLEQFKRTRLGRPKLLLSAFSNIAVDVLTQRVSANGLCPLRIGHESSLSADDSNGYSLLCTYPPMEWQRRIFHSDIICGTSIGTANDLLKNVQFDLILVDETTQSTEPALLVALSKLKENGKLVLIGDHQQLSPTVCSMSAQHKGLNHSVFERLIVEREIEPNFLDTQYRMHPKLAEFPSMYFYDGKLLTGIGAADRAVPEGFEWPVDGFPIAFVQTADDVKESEAVKSIENRGEAQIVARIVSGLVRKSGENNVNVISPYSAQKVLIEEELRRNLEFGDRNRVKVRTVDGFQGSECDIIVFSATRSNERSKVGFLKDYRRINVMLTRPRRGLIVVGDRETLENGDEMWAQWIRYVCDTNKAIVTDY